MLSSLAAVGVARCSLLVVPNYHRQGASLGEPAFVSWLRQLQGTGHEIVLHGYYHERARRVGESARQKMVTRVYTADEGEFYDLDYDQSLRLMRVALNEFTAHDFHPAGFIAPAWLLGAEAERAAIDAGFSYTTTLRGVRDFGGGRDFRSQSLVYSTRSDWRCAISLFWNRMLFRRLARNRLLRLGLHPPDIDHAGIWRQICALTVRAVRTRTATTYHGWLSDEPVPDPRHPVIA